MTHGRAQDQTVTIGGRRDGDVLAYRLEILQDAGAYPRIGAMLPLLTLLMAPGPYDIPRAESIATVVVTNTTPIGAYRGAGRPEATAAIERAIDLFAAEIGVDPAEVRRRNLLRAVHRAAPDRVRRALRHRRLRRRAGQGAGTPPGYAELRAEQAARRARGDVRPARHRAGQLRRDHRRRRRSRRRRSENATVEVHPDGTATILTGTSPHGQGHETAWAMLASEELGIPVDKITLKWGDTDLIPEGGGTGGSRSLQQGGAAVQQASRELIDVARRAGRGASSRPTAADLVFDADRSAFDGGRRPGRRGPAGAAGRRTSGCWSAPCSPRRAPRSRSARTSRSPRWTPRPARRCCAG